MSESVEDRIYELEWIVDTHTRANELLAEELREKIKTLESKIEELESQIKRGKADEHA